MLWCCVVAFCVIWCLRCRVVVLVWCRGVVLWYRYDVVLLWCCVGMVYCCCCVVMSWWYGVVMPCLWRCIVVLACCCACVVAFACFNHAKRVLRWFNWLGLSNMFYLFRLLRFVLVCIVFTV